ncbi:uncharacterized protein LOC134229248 isoform X2 [Saccostrea cucullata]|uniref:uncharacterized protein LOC134229248 isoform X2 n=1 Tax=Saccostrea cuccullata TaxID=36930 RepID=UPI002ED618B1
MGCIGLILHILYSKPNKERIETQVGGQQWTHSEDMINSQPNKESIETQVTCLHGTHSEDMINSTPNKESIETQVDGQQRTHSEDMINSQPNKESIETQVDGMHRTHSAYIIFSQPKKERIETQVGGQQWTHSEDMIYSQHIKESIETQVTCLNGTHSEDMINSQPYIERIETQVDGLNRTHSDDMINSKPNKERIETQVGGQQWTHAEDMIYSQPNKESIETQVTGLHGTHSEDMINSTPNKESIETQVDGQQRTHSEDMINSQPNKESIETQVDGMHRTHSAYIIFSQPNKERIETQVGGQQWTHSEDMIYSQHIKESIETQVTGLHGTHSEDMINSTPNKESIETQVDGQQRTHSEDMINSQPYIERIVTRVDGLNRTHSDDMINSTPNKESIETQVDGQQRTHSEDMINSQPNKESIETQVDGMHQTHSAYIIFSQPNNERIETQVDGKQWIHSEDMINSQPNKESIETQVTGLHGTHSEDMINSTPNKESIETQVDETQVGGQQWTHSEDMMYSQPDKESIETQVDGLHQTCSEDMINSQPNNESIETRVDGLHGTHSEDMIFSQPIKESMETEVDGQQLTRSEDMIYSHHNKESIRTQVGGVNGTHSEDMINFQHNQENTEALLHDFHGTRLYDMIYSQLDKGCTEAQLDSFLGTQLDLIYSQKDQECIETQVNGLRETHFEDMINSTPNKESIETQVDGQQRTHFEDMMYLQPDKERIDTRVDCLHKTHSENMIYSQPVSDSEDIDQYEKENVRKRKSLLGKRSKFQSELVAENSEKQEYDTSMENHSSTESLKRKKYPSGKKPLEDQTPKLKSKLNKKIDTIQQEDFNKSDRYVLECEKIDKDGESGEEIDDSEFLQRDQNIKGIYIKKYRLKKEREFRGQSKDTRIYDNTHACFFCGKVVLHIKEHLKTHKNAEEVKEIMAMDHPDFTSLRKRGDDKHNRQVLEKGEGEIILARRPTTEFDITNFGPCPECREWVLLKSIKYHFRECTKKLEMTRRKKKDLVLQSQILAGHIKGRQSPQMMKEVFPIMSSDNITTIAQNDKLILALGESWIKRNIGNVEKRKYYASSRMRLCARFLIQLQQLQSIQKSGSCADSTTYDVDEIDTEMDVDKDSKQDSLWDFLRPQNFDNLVLAALKCSFPNADDDDDLLSPSNAIKLKYDLYRLVNSKWALIVKTSGSENSKEAKECKTLASLMDIEWKERVTTIARAVLSRRKFDEKKELPSPEDIEKMTKHLSKELMETSLTSENFTRLVTIVQTRLLLYNKRRTGELEAIKVQSYASRSCGLDELDESLAKDLTDVEKHLMGTQDLMRVRGKRGRPVPVLIPPDCRKALAFLANTAQRKKAKIAEGNLYLFPNSVNGYVRAYDSLKTMCNEVCLLAPHRITSVSMRKYMATLTQMLNLDKFQMDWVCNHLGHTKSVHKEHYRQMSGLVERTQISKLLLIQDMNLTSKFRGKKLEDMDIKDIVFQDDADDEEEAGFQENLFEAAP